MCISCHLLVEEKTKTVELMFRDFKMKRPGHENETENNICSYPL